METHQIAEGRRSGGRLPLGIAVSAVVIGLGGFVAVDGARDGFNWGDGAIGVLAVLGAAFAMAEGTWKMTVDHGRRVLMVERWPFRRKEYPASDIEALTEVSRRQWVARVQGHAGYLNLHIGRLRDPELFTRELQRFAEANRLVVEGRSD